jgi:arylsulfatase A-like enzyme
MNIIKTLLLSLSFVIALISCSTSVNNETQKKPNVLFIIVDDMGWNDVGFMGSKWFETPNIDKLATEGMAFMQAYAGASNCAPSRASLMTGTASPRHGIYTVGTSERGNTKTRRIIPTENTAFLEDDNHTIGDLFQEEGYVTGTFGKWHLGIEPLNQGFDKNVAGGKNGNPGRNGYFSPYNVPNIEDGPEGEYLPDRITDEAIQFITDKKDTSFFAYLPYYTVHTPLLGKQELIDKYLALPNIKSKRQAIYGAMVEAMDINVGRLLKSLKELDLDENTMVVFTSDNGGLTSISPLAPLKAGKGSYYEGGIRVPLIVKWPGVIEALTTNEVPVTNLDFYPTFKDILKSQFESPHLDGESLLPFFQNEITKERSLVWHFPIYLEAYNGLTDGARDVLFRTRPGSVIRKGKWKLHQYFEKNEIELYNLAVDQGETNNIAESNPDIVNTLLKELELWRKARNAAVPTELNPEFDAEFEATKIANVLSKK